MHSYLMNKKETNKQYNQPTNQNELTNQPKALN